MKKFIRRLLLTVLTLGIAFGLYVLGNMIYATITDFQPPEKENMQLQASTGLTSAADSVYSFFIWNIGYGGLGKEEDFFYDGGKTVRPSKERLQANLDGIYKTIEQHSNADFILLQEVDTLSKRSRQTNELTEVAARLPQHNYVYATNYHVDFVPVPLENPFNALGKVRAGLATYSKYDPVLVTRYSFPGNFGWPKRVYLLDRCFLVSRYALPNGEELLVINTHNSAYDDGSIKAQQMEYLKNFMTEEYAKGNYIIVGGDWNQIPPGFDNNTFAKGNDTYEQINIRKDYLPEGWQWVYDASTPTNRKLEKPYVAGETFTTIIDFYLASPNIEVLEVKGVNVDFQYSDHQPVTMKVKLR